tara:strand:- start:256 stop:492 length:237 start_codon:yes stop_codon:yes gene_type:complete
LEVQFDGEEDLSSFTPSNDLVKIEVKLIPSSRKMPYMHSRIIRDFAGWVGDKGPIIKPVDLLNAENSNRCVVDVETKL